MLQFSTNIPLIYSKSSKQHLISTLFIVIVNIMKGQAFD